MPKNCPSEILNRAPPTGFVSKAIGDITGLQRLMLNHNRFASKGEGATHCMFTQCHGLTMQTRCPTNCSNLLNCVNCTSCAINSRVCKGVALQLHSHFPHTFVLAGTIPAAVGNLQNLVEFHFYSNRFTGRFARCAVPRRATRLYSLIPHNRNHSRFYLQHPYIAKFFTLQ